MAGSLTLVIFMRYVVPVPSTVLTLDQLYDPELAARVETVAANVVSFSS